MPVTLRPLSPLDPAQLPLDHHLGNGWVPFVTQSYPDQLSDGSLPPLRSARWIPGIGFRFNFSRKPARIADEACIKYLNTFPSLRSAAFSAERLRFRNSVFYRHVSLMSRDVDWHSFASLRTPQKRSVQPPHGCNLHFSPCTTWFNV